MKYYLIVVLVIVAGCNLQTDPLKWSDVLTEIRTRTPDVDHWTTAELARRIEQGDDLILIDVRASEEYAVSHLRHAISVPENDVKALKKLADEFDQQTLVLYCSVGYRSALAAQKLHNQGVTNVANLEGSLFKWANEDRPLFRGEVLTHNIHPFNSTWSQLIDSTNTAPRYSHP